MQGTRLGKLVQLLQRRTEEKKVVWEETVDENLYQAAFPNYIVQIGYRYGRDSWGNDATIYFIRILDSDIKTVEEVTDEDIKPELEDSYQVMENLYRSARRQAMGVDKALDSILSELENDN